MTNRIFPLVALTFLLASCRTPPTPRGSSSFTPVDDLGAPAIPADASKLKISTAMSIRVAPKPIPPLALPLYPHAAISANLRDIQLAAKLTINEAGQVADVAPSLARLPYTNAFHDAFFAAIDSAVRTWHFEPGQLAHVFPMDDGSPMIDRSEPEVSTIILVFTFSQTGRVSFSH
jgi:hypothetical protein